MTYDIGWDLYRSFLGVLREGSLSGAARRLGVAQPTIGRHIAALEEALGVALFTRSQSGLLPTDAASRLVHYAESMEAAAAALERVASSQGPGMRGTVRVTASDVIGVEVLPAIIAGLREQHPDLRVELALTNKIQDLLRREADIAVRMTRPRQVSLVARRVGTIELGLHATRRYLERQGTPRQTGDLARHALIGFDEGTAFVREAAKSFPDFQRDAFAISTDSDLAQLALIRAGAGIGICQVGLAKRDAALVRLFPDQFSLKMEIWVSMHEDLRNSPCCRITFDALAEGLRFHTDPP
ncbi:LysR family transcriptional regulator [Telmatospirillum siberiense]|uniref:LysR family transcriptional regulator n=1 Tax=Telmatospirillum siberiense TaxID=382514 RepID=A0A2N3PUI5_9PROT|nr:LysR family transcriptional regulator [Telmatospirillum siberiense]PKU24065.1 LysR family transcriptional regulator [Telmatospirillum siberiense]